MSKVNWTADQLTAIETTDKGVVVSAAAGSGKTAVLIERTIRLLEDREKNIPADRLLAVTFTVDAASQMKQKLADAFEKRLAEPLSEARKKWLQAQQDRLALAKISTINAFCLELVKNNLHEFEFQDGIKILDENDAAVIASNAAAQALDKLAERSGEDMNFLVNTLTDNNEAALQAYVLELYGFLRSLPFPDEWAKKQLDLFESDDAVKKRTSMVVDYFSEAFEKAEKYFEIAYARFFKINKKYKLSEDNVNAMLKAEENIGLIKKSLKSGDWGNIRRVLGGISWETVTVKGIKDTEAKDGVSAVKADMEICKKCIKNISDSVFGASIDIKADLLTSKRVFALLYELCLDTDKIAMEQKRQKNSLEFSDVEIMAIRLLVRRENGKTYRTPLAEEIVKEQDYRVILIDEFQDVNNLQELIFKAISDTDNLDIMGKNVFVVGDVKQSIYRFRRSNLKLFTDARQKAGNPENAEISKLVELKSNFRSRRNVIDFVNLIFENIMSEKVGELKYTGGERLVCGADYGGEDLDTEIMLVESDEDTKVYGKYYAENLAVAAKIREMLDRGVYVYNGTECRPCRPSDFCVLGRNAAVTAKLPLALERYGLKAQTSEASGYLRSREISVMINLLKIIDNPMQEIPMASVMLSPVMDFTADDAARLKLKCKELGLSHIYSVINAAARKSLSEETKEGSLVSKIDIDDEVLVKKCVNAAELLRRFKFYASCMTLARLIRRIYDETEMLAAASGYENSRQTRANLRMLLEYAASYENGGNGGITGFVRYLEAVGENKGDFKPAVTVTESEDSVIVKTIHKSKGLEYPFVFISGVVKQFNTEDLKGNMLLDEDMGIGFSLLDRDKLTKTETIYHMVIKRYSRSKLLSEEMRLLYVAMTRAREKLFIPITVNGISGKTKELANDIALAGGINERITGEAASFYDWLAAVLLCCEGNEEFLAMLGTEAELPQLKKTPRITFTVCGSASDLREDVSFYTGSPDSKTVERLRSIFDSQNELQEIIPSKVTVTELVRDEKEREYGDKNPEFYPQLPRLTAELGKQTAAQRGTCTHLFMELADYGNAENSVRDELKRLTDEGFFSQKEAEGVYIEALEKFFSGEFFARMKRSDEIIREKQFLVSFADLSLDEKYRKYVDAGTMLQGIADCIFAEGDSYILVDYKTDRFKDISELGGYKTQLELYKAALDKLLDKPVKSCYIYSFWFGQGVEIAM